MNTELTWQDIKTIVNIADALLSEPQMRIAVQNHDEEYYYTKVLEEYKKQIPGKDSEKMTENVEKRHF